MPNPPDIYSTSPEVYEEYISAMIEQRNFKAVADKVLQELVEKPAARILDMCIGTANFERKWLYRPDYGGNLDIFVSGIDTNKEFLRYAAQHWPRGKPHALYNEDAVTFNTGLEHDILVMTSAYHHIEDRPDDKKVDFLKNAKNQAASNALFVFYEKFVSLFSNLQEQIASGNEFYARRIHDISIEQEINPTLRWALYNEMQLTAFRDQEYKVSFEQFEQDLKDAGLKITSKKKLWPSPPLSHMMAGDWVVTARKA